MPRLELDRHTAGHIQHDFLLGDITPAIASDGTTVPTPVARIDKHRLYRVEERVGTGIEGKRSTQSQQGTQKPEGFHIFPQFRTKVG